MGKYLEKVRNLEQALTEHATGGYERNERNEVTPVAARVPTDTGLVPLLQRLRRGQAWLVEYYDAYMAQTEPEGVYVASLVAWDTLERLLRRLYPHFSGCISETGACDPGAPTWCTHCAEARPWER